MKDALAQLPAEVKRGRNLLVRTDGAGCTHDFLTWLTAKHRNFGYSIGFGLTAKHADAIAGDPGVREARRPTTPAGRSGTGVGHRRHRHARPDRLAARDAGDRAEGTPPPRRSSGSPTSTAYG